MATEQPSPVSVGDASATFNPATGHVVVDHPALSPAQLCVRVAGPDGAGVLAELAAAMHAAVTAGRDEGRRLPVDAPAEHVDHLDDAIMLALANLPEELERRVAAAFNRGIEAATSWRVNLIERLDKLAESVDRIELAADHLVSADMRARLDAYGASLRELTLAVAKLGDVLTAKTLG